MIKFKLDITMEKCPMTFVKTKIELEKLKKGDVLEVLLSEGEPMDNVPKLAKEQGYNVKRIFHIGEDVYKVVIQK